MDPNVHKKKKRRGRVTPADLQTFVDNTAMEMEDTGTDEDKTRDFNRKSLSRLSAFKDAIDSVKPQANFIQAVTNAKTSGSKWRKYATSRRLHKEETSGAEDGRRNKTCGLGLAEIHENFLLNNKVSVVDGKIPSKLGAENNRALIHYFADLGRKSDETVTVNLDFIESLLEGGAQVNCTDKHGQTVLHEVARAWHSDVAKFLIENGADVNQPDKYGRTPLHVAAAVDYPEMVNVLIEKHADREALTFEENQTPVHYAAKNDACMSLKALVKQGCQYKLVRDYKGRTPIHVAAELDRSETARFLLELGAPVGVSDNSGQKAITLMITKMAPVARDALDQFHKKYRAERRQYFYLNLLVQENKNGSEAQSPMQVAVSHRQHELLTHKVLLRLLKVQWKHFAWIRALYAMAFNLVFILLWTLIGVVVDYDKKHLYVFPEAAWRVVLIIVAGLLTVWQIGDEINEFRKSRKSHNLWRDWRLREIERDLKFAHPQWPEEGNFLKREEENLDNSVPKYFSDWWNIFDWVCYVLLLTSLITHAVDVASHTEAIARWHNRVMSFTIILLWLRLMKFARAFEPLGPFIVILAHMFGDVLRFAFLYLEFYIPFVCAFWMLFGGTKRKEDAPIGSTDNKIVVGRFQKINEVFFTLFRLTLVDEYDYDNMKLVDSVMADILLGAWFAVSAILCLNLFIALLSDTFQRVYDNAQANAVMQKAITVLSIWENLSSKRKRAFLERCAKPLMDDYDDDVTISGDEDLKKVTIQIKDQLDELEEKWDKQRVRGDTTVSSNRGSITGGTLDADIISLREGLNQVRDSQYELEETFKREMNSIKTLMLQLSAGHSGGGHSGSHSGGSHSGSHSAVGHQPSGPPAVDYADTRARSESPTGRYSRAIVPLLQSVHSQSEDRETTQTEKPRRKMKKKRSKPLLDVGGPASPQVMGGPTPPQVMGGPVSPQVMGGPASPQVMGEPASPQVLPVMYTQQAYTGGVTSYVPATLMELTSVTPLPPPRRRQQLHPTSDIRVRRDSGAGDGPHPDPTSEC